MKKLFVMALLSLMLTVALLPAQAQAKSDKACWGQATKVFAQMWKLGEEYGKMGDHASQEDTPRLGLRNLARALHKDGAIPDDSMQALGAFVAEALGLSIEACGTDT